MSAQPSSASKPQQQPTLAPAGAAGGLSAAPLAPTPASAPKAKPAPKPKEDEKKKAQAAASSPSPAPANGALGNLAPSSISSLAPKSKPMDMLTLCKENKLVSMLAVAGLCAIAYFAYTKFSERKQ